MRIHPLCVGFVAVISARGAQMDIHTAARENNIEQLRQLIEHGAQINAVDARGFAPLHHAARQGHAEALELLLRSRDILVNQRCQTGATALHLAAFNAHLAVTNALLDQVGIEPSLEDAQGDTPLSLAVAGMEENPEFGRVARAIAQELNFNQYRVAARDVMILNQRFRLQPAADRPQAPQQQGQVAIIAQQNVNVVQQQQQNPGVFKKMVDGICVVANHPDMQVVFRDVAPYVVPKAVDYVTKLANLKEQPSKIVHNLADNVMKQYGIQPAGRPAPAQQPAAEGQQDNLVGKCAKAVGETINRPKKSISQRVGGIGFAAVKLAYISTRDKM